MTGDIINLRTARKRRNRADKERQATENRRAFGQTKSERVERKADLERKAQALDGHLRIHKNSAATDQLDGHYEKSGTLPDGSDPEKGRPK